MTPAKTFVIFGLEDLIEFWYSQKQLRWISILMAVDINFGKDFNAVWVATRTQVGSTIVPKIDLGWILGGPGGSRP